jgi:hypothetical protein
MSKANNLSEFLTDVANAIRSKKGTTALINPQDFSAEIESIPSGGGGGSASTSSGSVRFLDYDGTVLHAYTPEEFAALSTMPELPTREGLVCQGWNRDIEDAKAYVAKYGALDVGATYITDDGKTRLYIKIAAPGRMDYPLSFSQSSANAVVVDWGDGSTPESFASTSVNAVHQYADIGDYCISLEVLSGALSVKTGSTSSGSQVYTNMLQSANIGDGVTSIGSSAFNNCYSLASITIPDGVTSIDANAFRGCHSLASITIPDGVTSIGTYTFNSCYSLASITIPDGVTSIGVYTFNSCYSLASITIPDSVTSIGDSAFAGCTSLASITIPDGVTSIGSSAFNNCYSLASITIPDGITSIGSSAFRGCECMRYFDFKALTAVPTLSAASAFTKTPADCQFVVPDALYDEWIAATNWATYASQIVKASEFNS